MLTPNQEEEIVTLYENGISVYEIASRFYIADTTVKNVLLRYGVYKGSGKVKHKRCGHYKDTKTKKRNEEIKAMREEGKTFLEISEKFGISVSRVGQILKKL
ncbi:MAG: helix-turn-helix domain-containing protein [Waterburya sp.]